MKRILVTGGAGFIGSHLCELLLQLGNSVICFDNLFTSSRRNIDHLLDRHDFEFVRGDVCDPFHFEVDEIWNLACPASPIHYQRNPARTIKTCVQGTIHALELAQRTGARLLVASTSEIYGDPLEHPQKETYNGNVNTLGPRACYDEGKRCAETLATSYVRQYGVQVRIARIFNCYGPRMAPDDGRVVSNFITQALAHQNLTVYGDGSQTRSFIYVSDLVDGLISLMDQPEIPACQCTGSWIRGLSYHRPGCVQILPSDPINLGNPIEFSMMELASEVWRAVGAVGTATRECPLPADDPKVRKPDITRAQQLLGWNPSVKLADGLDRTVQYFRALLGK